MSRDSIGFYAINSNSINKSIENSKSPSIASLGSEPTIGWY
jgi:hypothetical protein